METIMKHLFIVLFLFGEPRTTTLPLDLPGNEFGKIYTPEECAVDANLIQGLVRYQSSLLSPDKMIPLDQIRVECVYAEKPPVLVPLK